MEIIDIFALSDSGRLYALQWDNSDVNELERVLDFLTDVEELFTFFTANEHDLQSGFYGAITISEAVQRTRKEALALKRELLALDEKGTTQHNQGISTLFQPISKLEYNPEGFERHKAYGFIAKSMIRIYAVKLTETQFLITGGTIKLTGKMQDRPHTELELWKLDQAIDYLKDQGIYL